MDEQKQSLETLQDIKRMMERSSRFISLSGLSGISAGICALIGAWFSVDYVYGRKDYIIDQDTAIAQVAAKHCPVPIEYVGTKDTFGESGTPVQLLKKYGLDIPDIVTAAEKVMGRKNNG